MMLKQKGFTIVELLIAVAIVGILAAVAMPSYNSYTLKVKRSDAKVGLMQMADSQERFYLVNNRYAANNNQLFGSATKDSPKGKYRLTVNSGDSNQFLIHADAQGEQIADTACLQMTYTQAGTKTPAECWD